MSGGGISRILVQGKEPDQSWMFPILEQKLDDAALFIEQSGVQFKELARRRVDASSKDNPLSRSSAAAEMEAIMATGIDSLISRTIEYLLNFQIGLRQSVPGLSSRISNRTNPGPPDVQPQGYSDILRSDDGHGASAPNASEGPPVEYGTMDHATAESDAETDAEEQCESPYSKEEDKSIVPRVASEPRLPPVNSETQPMEASLLSDSTLTALPAGNPDEGSPWVKTHHVEFAKGIMRSHYLCVHNQSDGTRCPAKRTVDHSESGEVILESQKGEHVHGSGLAMAASDDVPGGDASKAARTAPDQYQVSGSVEGGHGKMPLSLSTTAHDSMTAGNTGGRPMEGYYAGQGLGSMQRPASLLGSGYGRYGVGGSETGILFPSGQGGSVGQGPIKDFGGFKTGYLSFSGQGPGVGHGSNQYFGGRETGLLSVSGYGTNVNQDKSGDGKTVTLLQPQTKRSRSHMTEIRDDYWNWRKYGQKAIKADGIMRRYYKCGHKTGDLVCPAKRQVDKSEVDGHVVAVMYEGKHNHEKPEPKTTILFNQQSSE